MIDDIDVSRTIKAIKKNTAALEGLLIHNDPSTFASLAGDLITKIKHGTSRLEKFCRDQSRN